MSAPRVVKGAGWWIGLVLLLMLAACAAEGAGDEERLTPAEASRRVSELLYDRNLIADPEVNAKMNEYVLAVSRDGAAVDSVMPEFHEWLASWVRAYPDRAAAARLAGASSRPSRAEPGAGAGPRIGR